MRCLPWRLGPNVRQKVRGNLIIGINSHDMGRSLITFRQSNVHRTCLGPDDPIQGNRVWDLT